MGSIMSCRRHAMQGLRRYSPLEFGTDSAKTAKPELWTLSGKLLGTIDVPETISAWSLIQEAHVRYPPPPGSFWELAIGTEKIDGVLSLAGVSMINCIAVAPAEAEQTKVIGEVQLLLRQGSTVDLLQFESHLIWWYALQSLRFGVDFNHSIDKLKLPDGLQSLEFGYRFNQKMHKVKLPDGLRSLEFGEKFNQSMDRVKLPDSLQRLRFGGFLNLARFNQRMDKVKLPDGLRSLKFGDEFNQSMQSVKLPNGLQSLEFGKAFNQSMDNVDLPGSLQSLRSCHLVDQSMDKKAGAD
mmetsp:Transcript_89355/g.168322  ORF Transcript_89355/g.168322 Transcript_89355/m.168322 type:complete len:296 (-) Transcript_89355:168-1055(-)